MPPKTIHELEIEFAEWKAQQKHLMETVDKLHNDMREVKVAVFQAKWALVGAMIFAGILSSDALMSMILNFGAK